jgi:antitoxin (DNA-binding transcriptional repressor) of toxin-antitoxin stability system
LKGIREVSERKVRVLRATIRPLMGLEIGIDRLRKGSGKTTPPCRGVGLTTDVGEDLPRRWVMDLRRIEAIGVGRLKKEFHELLRQLEAGFHYQLLRFDKPVAALIPYLDYVAFTELARQDALAKALLQGKGYDPESMTEQQYLDLLAANLREVSHGNR